MNIKVTIVLLAVFLAGLVVFLLVNTPPAEDDGLADLWPGFAITDVSGMIWDAGTGEVKVRRSGEDEESWEVFAGKGWVQAEIDPLLDVLNEVERFEIRSRKSADEVSAQLRVDAGLTPPRGWFRFVMRGETHELTLGGTGIGRDTMYAAIKGSDDVLVIGDGLLDTLLALRVDDLRRRRMFRWLVSDIDRLAIERDGKPVLKAARHEKDASVWWAEFPFRGYLDPATEGIEGGLLGWMLRLEISDFVSDEPDEAKLAECGLKTPRFKVTLRKARGEDVVRTILIGGDVAGDATKYYFMVEGQPLLLAAKKAGLIEQLEKDPAELRDRNLTRLGWRPLAEFGGSFGAAEFRLKKVEGVWTVEEPEGMTVDADSIEDWLNKVRALPILEFIDSPDLAALGLAEPAGRLTFRRPLGPDERAVDAKVPPVAEILLGNSTDKGVYVRRSGQDGIAFLAPPVVAEILRGGAWQFRAKDVFEFRPRDQAPTRIERSGFGKKVESDWKGGTWTNDVKAELVKNLSSDLLLTRSARWVGPAEGRDEEYGTGRKPTGSIMITYGSGERAVVYGLRIGKEAPGGRYARAVREGQLGEAIFVIPRAALDLLYHEEDEPDDR